MRGGRPFAVGAVAAFALLALASLALVAPSRAFAQGCCTPGAGPLTGLRAGGLPSFTVRGGLAWDQYDLRTTLKGSQETEPLAEREARYSRLTLHLEAGLPALTRLAIEAPWEFRSREVVLAIGGDDPARLDFENSAFGDLTTALLIEVAPRAATPRPWSIEVGGGVKWATGSIDAEDDGRALPPELQSGTGSTDPLALAAARYYAANAGIVGTFLYRATGTNDIGYQFGREADVGVAAWWAFVPAVSAGADIRWRTAEHDEFLGITRPNSGGTRWLAGPRVAARLPYPGPSFEVAGLFPVHQDLNGTQLGVDVQWTLAISWQGR